MAKKKKRVDLGRKRKKYGVYMLRPIFGKFLMF